MRCAVVGLGASGARVSRQLASSAEVESLALLDSEPGVAAEAAERIGPPAFEAKSLSDLDCDAVVIASGGDHLPVAMTALRAGSHVISTAGDRRNVAALMDLDDQARAAGKFVVVGAGFSPGLSCLLVNHFAVTFDTVEEVHVARVGWGGPACRRNAVSMLRSGGEDWVAPRWIRRGFRSGRSLNFFPDPIGAHDAYAASTGEPLLLRHAFPGLSRITSRVAAGRRKLLSRQVEDPLGAIRVELRGRRGAAWDVAVAGAIERPALAVGAVAAVAALWSCTGRFDGEGSGGLAALVSNSVPFLHELSRRGLRAAVFEPEGVAGARQA